MPEADPVDERDRARPSLALVAVGVAWLVFSLALGLELCLWLDLAGPGRLGEEGPAARVDHVAIHHQVVDAMRSGRAVPADLSSSEAEHIRQVGRLVLLARILGGAAVLIVIASWSRLGRRGLRAGAVALGGTSSGLALAALDWPVFFRCVHPLLFGAGDWDFDPNRHLLAALYTPSYFALRALPGLIPVLALGAAGWALGAQHPHAPRRRWSRSRAWIFLCAGPALALGWGAGQHLDLPWSWGYRLWIGATAGAVLGCLLVVHTRGGQIAVAVLLAAAACLLGISLGLRQVGREAIAASRDASHAITALDAAFRAGERYRSLAEVPAEIREVLPDPPPGFGEWYYLPQRWGYLLGFRGPLAWHYEYHSQQQRWSLPTY